MGTRRHLLAIGKSKQCGDNMLNCVGSVGNTRINFQRDIKKKKKGNQKEDTEKS